MKIGDRGTTIGTGVPARSFRAILALGCALAAAACATPKLPPPPPRYVQEQATQPQAATANSLWRDGAGLFEDPRARRVNDLVTINVIENITAAGKADTSASRDSSLDAGVNDLFNFPLGARINNGRFVLTPTAKGFMKDDFKGSGATTREGKLVGTITAKVVEILPNGNLVLESRKEITVNNEKQILVFQGMARPEDIAMDNSIMSDKVADSRVFFVGDGVLQDKQRPGWLVRLLDKIWPF